MTKAFRFTAPVSEHRRRAENRHDEIARIIRAANLKAIVSAKTQCQFQRLFLALGAFYFVAEE